MGPSSLARGVLSGAGGLRHRGTVAGTENKDNKNNLTRKKGRTKMKNQTVTILAGLAALMAAGITTQAQYTFTTLDDPLAEHAPGFGTFLENRSGDKIVGNYYDSGGNSHGLIYDISEKTWTTLDQPSAAGFSVNYWISDNKIIGGYVDSVGDWHGFLYDLGAKTWTTLDDPLAGPGILGGADPYFISGRKIVGNYYDSSGLVHGMLYDEDSQTWTTVDYPLAEDTSIVSFRGDELGAT